MPPGIIVAKSGRGRNNYMYAIEALNVLGCEATADMEPTPFPLIVDWRAGNAGRRGAIKFGVLTELGRAAREYHPDVVRMMATRVSEALADRRLVTARDAELQVRDWREALRRKPDTDADT